MWERCRGVLQKLNKKNFLVLGLFGALLLVLAIPVSEDGSEVASNEFIGNGVKKQEELILQKDREEQRLEAVLSAIEGVGAVRVMITYETAEDTNEHAMFGDLEEKQVGGVLVVAQGAGNSYTKQQIVMAVMSLFGLDANKITVAKMSM